jgi:hypothetical protein
MAPISALGTVTGREEYARERVLGLKEAWRGMKVKGRDITILRC